VPMALLILDEGKGQDPVFEKMREMLASLLSARLSLRTGGDR